MVRDPSFARCAAMKEYRLDERLAIAVAATFGRKAPGGGTADTVAGRVAAALAPANPLNRD